MYCVINMYLIPEIEQMSNFKTLYKNIIIKKSEISNRLGHESIKTTLDIYAHLYPDKDTELAENLNSLRKE